MPQLINPGFNKVSIHAPYAGSDCKEGYQYRLLCVSIHAPYAGSDDRHKVLDSPCSGFNPRPLCRERLSKSSRRNAFGQFQSTPPMQGATQVHQTSFVIRKGFNPRPLCRERRVLSQAGRACKRCFNPRPLCRERRFMRLGSVPRVSVSIHAPYAGSDAAIKIFDFHANNRFQSTPPMQGATAISAKNSSSFSAEIDKLSFQILKFPLFSSPLRLQNTPFVHI